jgi:DNA mismatch repair protein MutS2
VARRLEERLEEILERTRDRLEEEGEIEKPGQVRQELYQARREALSQVAESVSEPVPAPSGPAPAPGVLRQGQAVKVESLGQTGTLLEDPRDGVDTVPVAVGPAGVRLMARVGDLCPLPAGNQPPSTAGKGISVRASAGDGLDLNLVGMTVDEALPLVEKALDQALLSGKAQISLVHGVGTGRLRQAVRSYLSEHPSVAAALPGPGRQGAAVTVAELRQ